MHNMILRVFIALVGAAVVTVGLLLGMNAVTSLFRERTGERVFRIMDVERAKVGRPERPPVPERAPRIPKSDAELPQSGLTAEPLEEPVSPLPQNVPVPAIEPPQQDAPDRLINPDQ
jgi:hypothetical protein